MSIRTASRKIYSLHHEKFHVSTFWRTQP